MVYHEQNMHKHTHTNPHASELLFYQEDTDTIIKSNRVRSTRGFPGSLIGEESTCNAGGPGSIPGSGRSPGEGLGYPFQYSWASLVAQLVKNPPVVWETWV